MRGSGTRVGYIWDGGQSAGYEKTEGNLGKKRGMWEKRKGGQDYGGM